MKYRWTTQIMTRDSGMLIVYCKDQRQAEINVSRFTSNRIAGHKTIAFENYGGSANIMLLDEVISVSVGDQDLFRDVHKEEAICCKELHRQVELTSPDEDD